MTSKDRLFVVGIAVACVLTIAYLAAACASDTGDGQAQPSGAAEVQPGETSQPTAVMAVSPVSGTFVTADVPIDYGPFRIFPSTHPEAREVGRGTSGVWPLPPVIATKTVSDTRKHIPAFKEPAFLPEGFELAFIEGFAGSAGSFNIEASYRERGQMGRMIRIWQIPVQKQPIPVTWSTKGQVQDLQLGQVGGRPAVLMVPKKERPATNPRSLQWVQDGVLLGLDSGGWPDMDVLIRVASSMK